MVWAALSTTGRYTCLSTDSKTTAGIATGSLCHETDTGNQFIYDGSAWQTYHGVTAVTFHDGATVAADGTAFTVGYHKTLVVEITRTAGSSTVAFMGEGPSGADIALMGVNLTTLGTAISTTGTGELWQFDITGLTKVFMGLTAVVTGPVTVKGRAVI
jgi:hypothetical protein